MMSDKANTQEFISFYQGGEKIDGSDCLEKIKSKDF
jgi:hypothetical protein